MQGLIGLFIFVAQFVDKKNGEWIGYLNRQGEVSMDFKGGAFKGKLSAVKYIEAQL